MFKNKHLQHLRATSLKLLLGLLLSATPLLWGCPEQAVQVPERRPEPQPPEAVSPADHGELKSFFAARGYDWDTLHHGIPPFFLESLPGDLDRIARVEEKKRVFFLSMLPMVLLANEEIDRKRRELTALLDRHDAGSPLSAEEDILIASLAREYGLKDDPLADEAARSALLRRVDTIPPSLALAQAATESAYGTSRFARLGNNLFGEWTFTPGTGLVPKERPPGATYEVRRFASLYDSVRSYMRNLNTHRAYRPFRLRRAELRTAGLVPAGIDLAAGLERYSTRGTAYIEDLRAIIRRNGLSLLATVALRPPPLPPQPAEPAPLSAGLLASAPNSSRHAPPGVDP